MTTSTLRPNGTTSSTFTLVGTTVHGALSDDSDSTYVEQTATTDETAICDATTFTLPAGAVVASTRCRARAVRTGAESDDALTVWAFNTDLSNVYSYLQTFSLTASIAEYTGGWDNGTGGLLPTTQALIDALEIRVTAQAARIHEVYVDVKYVTQPSTTVTNVNGGSDLTTTNIVPIAWTNTLDSDGGAQTRYHVKVFTDAQYGAGGFDPETSTPYWNSGNTVSAASTVDTGPLENDTYRAYVKVAQTVNGASHWSAFAYDEFVVAVTTSDVTSVTLVASNSTASVAVTVNRDTGSSAWDYVEVQRTIDSGTTWTDVRGATYVDATGGANSFAVTDYEVGNAVTVTYRARATRIVSTLPITGSWTSSSSTSWTSTSCFLKSPTDSSLNTTVSVRVRPTVQRSRAYGTFRIVGSAYPVVVSDTLGGATSMLEIRQSLTDTSLLTLLSEPVLLLHPPPAWNVDDQYLAPLEVTYTPGADYADTRVVWSVSVVEVEAPGDPLASSP